VIPAFLFLAAQAGLALFGLPAAFHPSLRGEPLSARATAAFGAGAVALTVEATLFSIFGIRWTVPSLALPLLAGSVGLSIVWSRRRGSVETRRAPMRAVAAAALAVIGVAIVHIVLSLGTARATSTDFALFWGVKGARFAAAGGIDATLLGGPFSHHLVPDYPPLVPITLAWSALFAGGLPWQIAPVGSAIWVVAAVPLVFAFLRRRVSPSLAAAVTAFWAAALAVSMVHSGSGGNAEAPLLFFESVALAALLGEDRTDSRSRFVAALALMGAALTKVEGSVAVLLVLIGVAVRDRFEARPDPLRRLVPLAAAPLFGVALWFAFQVSHGLPVGYRTHGGLFAIHFRFLAQVLSGMVARLEAGTGWLAWLVPLALLTAGRPRNRFELAPAWSVAVGLLLFSLFDYLHDVTDPSVRIGWTLPRISQPALSAWILAAGVASSPARPSGRSADIVGT
jgi:hypothetical protein